MIKELRLSEFAGQRCDAVLVKRDDGSKFVRFDCTPGYGGPYLEEKQLDELRKMLTNL